MKSLLKPTAVFAAFLLLGLSAQATQTSTAQGLCAAPANTVVRSSAPSVISDRVPLTREELAKYQQQDASYQTTRAAGSDDDHSWWIIGGAVVAVGLVILIAGGGHGSGGSGY